MPNLNKIPLSIPDQFKRVSYYLSIVFVLIGFTVLLGWITGIDRLKSLTPHFISVKVNTAICFLLSGLLMLLHQQKKKKAITGYLISLFAVIIFLFGSLTLMQYYLNYDFGIDELFFKDAPNAIETLFPGRQTPFNALFFLLFGLSFLPYLRKIKHPPAGQLLNLLIATLAFMTFITYSFSTETGNKNYSYLIISFQSSFAFIFLALAAMFLKPEEGLMKIISCNSVGGKLFRKIFPFSLIVFLLLGWFVFRGKLAGYYIPEVGISIFIISSVIVFTILLFKTSNNLTRREKVQKQTENELKKSEEKYRKLIKNASDAILIVDKSFKYLEVNTMAVTMLGYSQKEFLNLTVEDITVMNSNDTPLSFTGMQNSRIIIQEREFKRKDGSLFPVEISTSLLDDGNYLAIVRDISERKKLEKIINNEKQVLEMIATDVPLDEILNTIALNYESIAPFSICSILLLDDDSKFVKKAIGPSLPAKYNRAVQGFPVGPAEGSCGTAAYRKERVIVSDISTDPLWINYRDLPLKFNLFACWSSPIMDNEKVLGSFAIYYNEIRVPTYEDFKMIDRAASQVKIALVRHLNEISIKENEAKFSKVFHNPGYAYAILNDERRYLDINHSFEELIEHTREDLIGKTSAEAGMNSLEFIQQSGDLVFKLMKEGKLENIEIEFESRTGKEKTILLSVHTINLNDSMHWLLSLVDISEKKKAEKALMASEEKYRTLVEQASDAIFIADSSGRMLTVNKSACKLAECTEQELLQMSIYDFAVAEDLEKHPFHFDELKTGKTVITERVMYTKSKRLLQIEVTAKFLSDGRLLIFLRDISERKKAEQLLKDNEQRLTRAENMGSLGHGYYDILTNNMHISAGLYKIFGVKQEEFTHTIEGLKGVIHPDDYQVMDQAVDSMFKDGEVEVEFRIVQPTGKVRNVLFKTILTRNSRNELTSSFTTALDITERKKTAAERQALLFRNEQIIATMLDGFILASEKGNIIEVNPAYCKMIGYSRKELLGININQIEASLSEKEIEHRITQMIEHKSLKFETRHCRKDNVMIDLEVSVSIMISDEQPLVAAFVRDITEKKKVQQQVEHYNNQLRQLTAHLQSIREEERRRIGREIHDDLGQQLTAIKMDVAWIDKKTAADEGLIKEKLKNIIGLLDGSNLSVRRILTELKPSILDEYGLMDALNLHAKQFTQVTGIPAEIISDQKDIQLAEDVATCIFRVFQESLTNITRYAKAKNVKISIKIKDEKITAFIKDDGVGFDTAVLQTKNSFGILGMHERVRALAGYFEIKSTVGKGTVVKIILPLKTKVITEKSLPL